MQERPGQEQLADQQYVQYQQLAEAYGTPLYVYDSQVIQQRIDELRASLHPAIKLFYSMKANPNPSIVNVVYNKGIQLEICSPRELDIALSAGVNPERILYLGPGKSRSEIERILALSIRYFVVESVQELAVVQELAEQTDKHVQVGIRFNPQQVKAGARLRMGGTARQFGIDEDQLPVVLEAAKQLPNVRISGLHGYLGTRILQADTIVSNTAYILNVAQRLVEDYGIELRYVGLGGGYGVPYEERETPLDLQALADGSSSLVEAFVNKYPSVELLAESGRYLVAESGIYLTRVRYTKQSQGVHYAIMDGGIHHHAAAGSVGSIMKRNFPIQAYITDRDKLQTYHISGPLCTPDDLIGRGVSLPELFPGDLIGIMRSGAYGLTFSPVLFLSHDLPKEVMIKDGQAILIRDNDEYGIPKLALGIGQLNPKG